MSWSGLGDVAEGQIVMRVPTSHQGQTGMGQGGYSCYLFADAATRLSRGSEGSAGVEAAPISRSDITIALRRPIPLETDLVVRPASDASGRPGWELVDPAMPDQPILQGVRWEPSIPATPAVSLDAAEAARTLHAMSAEDHPAPLCLSCGLGHDSLRVHAGPLADADPDANPDTTAERYATPLRLPADSASGGVDEGLVWMAIDCACGWFTARSGATPGSGVTVQYAVDVLAPLRPETDYVLVAWHGAGPRDWDGRKRTAAAAVFDIEGTLMARSQSLWVRPAATPPTEQER